MNRFLLPLAAYLYLNALTPPLEASHEPQANESVITRIVEDVWDSPEYCYPCTFGDTGLFARTLRIETNVGQIIALDITFSGVLNQAGDGFSLIRDSDTHFLFDEVADTLIVLAIRDDQEQLSGNFHGFTPFVSRDVAHVLLGGGDFPYLSYEANVTVDLGNNNIQQYTLFDSVVPGFIPEPSTATLLLVGVMLQFVARRGRGSQSHRCLTV